MTFETEQDIFRENKAISVFVNTFGGSFKKLDPKDIDFKVFDKDGVLIAYVEVKGRIKPMINAYPLPVSAKKILKLVDKRLNPVVIWCCEDGIIYGQVKKLKGEITWGGRTSREGSFNDTELMVFYEKQKGLKYIRFL
jgi:hypothetical protein